MIKKEVSVPIGINEFVHNALEAIHLVIFESLAEGYESFDIARQSYGDKDIEKRYEEYLNQFRSKLISVEFKENIANALEVLWREEESNPDLMLNLVAVSQGNSITLLSKSNLGSHLITLSNMAAFYCANITYMQEKNESLDLIIKSSLKAGAAIGRIYGIHEEISRNNYTNGTREIYEIGQNKRAEIDRQSKSGSSRPLKSGAAEAKKHIKNAWLDWQGDPEIYESLSEFAKCMRRDFKDIKCTLQAAKLWDAEWHAEIYVADHWEEFIKTPYGKRTKELFIEEMFFDCRKWEITRQKIDSWISPPSLV